MSGSVQFWKMHGLGNDYIVIDNRDEKICDKTASALAKKLCTRRFSIGADGLLLVCNSKVADVKMRIFNSDGSEAEMCGNGIRCFSKYCYETGISKKSEFQVETLSGVKNIWLSLNVNDDVVSVKVDMGIPNWNCRSLSMNGMDTCINYNLAVDKENCNVTCLSMGNPHCVMFVENVDKTPVERVGPLVENHPIFSNRANVGFVQVISENEIKVRVWERGCGETLACGTGICAAVAVANKLGKVGNNVFVHVLGGDLQVEIGKNSLFLSGAAEKVYHGMMFGEI
ncbi:MAG: diaminopimelate epimerase [Candidatus Bathyarchaeota archaeon]|uniref:diaminopimelate epimerase n=1 Tax=Candidatus Bathycorpusculum sp. TaxID=2994959 RepID=UPI0028327CC3|nr:diaminopimelate epimerase [Candidatus Termiticorpusculum sp.]MCL2257258.1 diaminopimelate epimerase [Candidatus Termiticorpusculum sp.]MCL2292591.1 diaminopimelate epimerase [Candidatus Termiticorpusculum sp.]